MKQCPRKCEIDGRPIGDVAYYVGIDGFDDATYLWTCDRLQCRDAAILQQDRGHPRYGGVRRIGPMGRIALVPDVEHPLRGEVVVRTQQIRRVDVELVSQRIATQPPRGIVLP